MLRNDLVIRVGVQYVTIAPRTDGAKLGHFHRAASLRQLRTCGHGLIITQPSPRRPTCNLEWREREARVTYGRPLASRRQPAAS